MWTRSRAGAPALLLLLLSFLTGCGPSGPTPAGVLRLPLYDRVRSFDPALVSSDHDLLIASLLYSGLVKFGPDLHVIPELAVSIPTISFNGLAYTFTVRNDARFADGRPVTAHDVAYSLTRALRLGGGLARRYLSGISGAERFLQGKAQSVSGIHVLRRLTIRIRLWRADAEFLQKLAFPIGWVVDRRVAGNAPMRSWRPAGTGPWEVAAQASDGTLTLRARPHFYGSPLTVRQIILRPVKDDAAALALYRKGGLDVARVPDGERDKLANAADIHDANALDAYYAIPHGLDASWLANHLDRDGLAQAAGNGLAPLATIVPPAVPDYVSSPPSIDVTGDAPSAPLQLDLGPVRDPILTEIAHALGRQWSVRVTRAEGTLAGPHITLIHAGYMLPDPGAWLTLVLPETKSTWYRNSLAQANLLTNDPVTRMDMYDQCERWALGKGLIVPLAVGSTAYLIKGRINGLQVTPEGIMPDNNNWARVAVT